MGTQDIKKCKCGATPVVARTNKTKWRVMCPACQRFYTRDKDSREESVAAWNNNIEAATSKKKKAPAK